MKVPVFIFLASLLATGCVFPRGSARSADQDGNSAPFVQCDARESDIQLCLSLDIRGVDAPPWEHIFFFRRALNLDQRGSIQSSGSYADGVDAQGRGIGTGYSVSIIPRGVDVSIRVTAYWTTSTDKGEAVADLVLPIGLNRTGEAGRFDYRAVWQAKLNRGRPNKSLQPTATPVMPPAAQEIMPGVAVAEH